MFEYKTVEFRVNHFEEIEQLNKLGLQGWEVVCEIDSSNYAGIKSISVLLLKRYKTAVPMNDEGSVTVNYNE